MTDATSFTISTSFKHINNTVTTIEFDTWWLFRYYRNITEANSETPTFNKFISPR